MQINSVKTIIGEISFKFSSPFYFSCYFGISLNRRMIDKRYHVTSLMAYPSFKFHCPVDPELIPAEMISHALSFDQAKLINTYAENLRQVVSFLKRHIASDIDELWRQRADLPHLYDNDTVGEPIIYWLHEKGYTADTEMGKDVRKEVRRWLRDYGYTIRSRVLTHMITESNRNGWYVELDMIEPQ